jgi:putative selenium metabolism protein SsnA
MEASSYVLGNGVVSDGVQVFESDGALLIEDGKIARIGTTSELKKENAKFVDVHGRLIIPGLLNGHHHLYSHFAPGISPLGETNNFRQILENLWWKLDMALDEESVYYSALMGLIDSIKHGSTMVFDHHASMQYVEGSLSLIQKAYEKVGIKGLACFETSDRHGEEEFHKHVEENISFHEKNKNNEMLMGLLGLHANLTLTDGNLTYIKKKRPADMPIHIHCGEDASDLMHCTQSGYKGPAHRLFSFGLVDNKSILAHAIHLNDEDYAAINHFNAIVVSNPESNANNRVGKMGRKYFNKYILGTDGMSGDMIKTLRSHYLLGEGNKENFEELNRVFFSDRYEIQNRFFPRTGEFIKGNAADIAVLNYVPLSPINKDNVLGHLIFGAKGGHVNMTIVNGKVLFQDGEIKFLNEYEENIRARKIAKGLHERYYSFKR